MKALNVLGLNSGTSMDGIDAAVFEIAPAEKNAQVNGGPPKLETKLIYSKLVEFEPGFRENLARLVNAGNASLKDICLLNAALGKVFANASVEVLDDLAKEGKKVDLIGSHGQTIWHEPIAKELWGVNTSATLQLGDGAEIAAKTGLPVICDFRTNDIALGGQGAPLVSFADEVLFGSFNQPVGVLNIGGIANLTVIGEDGRAKFAYDSGPGNMIVDRFCEVLFNKSFDEGGNIARSGSLCQSWLKELTEHPYFGEAPPKTTGREDFGHKFADQLLEDAKSKEISSEDALCTVTHLTAKTIADSYNLYIKDKVNLDTVVLGGGGGQNKFMVELLQKYWDGPLATKYHEDYGISTKFKESLLFALLAYTTYFEIPNNVPVCTGATRRTCLGKLTRG